MDKTAIKKFAVWARRKLIEDIQQKAFELGITENEIKEPQVVSSDAMVIGDRTLNKVEMEQRKSLISKVQKGFDHVVEEVAYTWFNRFIALRFMEVNEYLPTGFRVLSSVEPGKKEPDVINEALNIDLNVDRELIYKYQDANDTVGIYRYLLVKQCNALYEILPGLFEQIEDYTEILLPSNLLSEGSVIRELVDSITEGDFKEQVEIIGWMYQYYISEKKDEVFEGLKNNIKITKENIPAATQLFTPDWIVKYMVENSLGRLWLEGHPNDELKARWQYYLEEAEQDSEVKANLEALRKDSGDISPLDIKFIDPCMGSGHIIIYAFEVLMDIYKSVGYGERDATKLILEYNLYGLDIDDRAYQLAYFAIMMKARGYNRRILNEGMYPHLCSIQETPKYAKKVTELLIDKTVMSYDKTELKNNINYLLDLFQDAKEYGSILDVKVLNFSQIEEALRLLANETIIDDFNVILPLVKQAELLASKYDVVVTNPPYMGGSGMSANLSYYVKEKYPNSKSDMFGVFIERGFHFLKQIGYNAMVTMQSWMFLSSFERLRKHIATKGLVNLIHIGYNSFPELNSKVAQASAFVLANGQHPQRYISTFLDLNNKYSQAYDKKEAFFKERNASTAYIRNIMDFSNIPGMPIAYWVSDKTFAIFNDNKRLLDYLAVKNGMSTTDNNRFTRNWNELEFDNIGIGFLNALDAKKSNKKWFPYNKGGEFRKWYGNIGIVVNWKDDGKEIKKAAEGASGGRIVSQEYYFMNSISWSKVTTGQFVLRRFPDGFLFDVAGPSIFGNQDLILYVLGLMNSVIKVNFLQNLYPTINFEMGQVSNFPMIVDKDKMPLINELVQQNINISKTDWDSFETSWDFQEHPLLQVKADSENVIKDVFDNWRKSKETLFHILKANERELNNIFIEIYKLQDELTPEVDDKDITIRKADIQHDIRSFLSYSVGCMFGRYSLDIEGLVYAGGEWTDSKYTTFTPDTENIIPITDDEYFEDDIVTRFINFVQVTFGNEKLEQNIDFIAETLGKKSSETSKQAIRRYFIKDFYKDHIQVYKKKPIYWLFDSGKQDGFKGLIYMHRYDEFTVAKVRTDYLHKLQKSYEAEVKRLDIVIDSSASERDKANAKKKKEKILKQMEECLQYDQVVAHVANQRIKIDLDEGVSINYAKFQGVEIPQGEGKKPLKADLLAKI